MVRGDVRKKDEAAAPVVLTAGEFEALAEAAYAGGRGAWISKAEVAAVESIIAARLAGA
jgi:hypothetical protein